MAHIKALAMKIAMVALVLLVVLSGFYGYPVLSTIVLSLLIVAVSYIVGDLLILRKANNTTATISDFAVVLFMTWFAAIPIYGTEVPFIPALISAIIIAAGEWVFHKYVSKQVHPEIEGVYSS
ncbi:DUF2512 family protein [Thalassorhabdus alkalitolerans]|uniref:DUF2512 family protein n=1 Tax=Thalassorhabdus alkalitolerans TaxID=2282697 RepID=A0ABW0YVE9_9BACI